VHSSRVVRAAAAALAVGAALCARPTAAALVIFEDGRHVHVTGFEVIDDRVSLALDGGGSMSIPLDRVDRIVEDEVEPAPPPPAVVPILPLIPVIRRSIRVADRPAALPVAPFENFILAAAREHRIDPALISAVIRVESNYAARAVSRKGARGLMQLMPATAHRLGVRRSFDPRENIRGGTAYLAELASRFGETSVELILAAYNAGEHAVEEYKGVPPYRETRDYVRRVTGLWRMAHGEAPEASPLPVRLSSAS
jgi:Transglycosylase SLT domain